PGDCARGAPAQPGPGQCPRPAADGPPVKIVRLGGCRVASQHKLHRQTPAILGLLDIGTSKTVCFIVAGARLPRRGAGQGLGGGEKSSRAGVTEAERAAGCELRQVLLAVASGRLKSTTFAAEAKIEGRAVAD